MKNSQSRVVCRTWLTAVLALLSTWAVTVHADDWPQWRGPNRDGVWSETGIFEMFPPDGLKVLWRAPVGIGFSSPVVAGGRVFVTDSELAKPKARERVHAFDAVTGEQQLCRRLDLALGIFRRGAGIGADGD